MVKHRLIGNYSLFEYLLSSYNLFTLCLRIFTKDQQIKKTPIKGIKSGLKSLIV